MEQGGFAGTAGADEGDVFAGGDGFREIADDGVIGTVGEADVFEVDAAWVGRWWEDG